MSIAAALVCLARLLLAAAAMTIVYLPFAEFPVVNTTLRSHGVFEHDCDSYVLGADCLARDMHFWWLLACTVAAFGLGSYAALLVLKLDTSPSPTRCRNNSCRCCQNRAESSAVVIGTRMLLPVGTLVCTIARSVLMGPIGEDNVYNDRRIPFVAAYSLLSFAAPLVAAGSLAMLTQLSPRWFLRGCVLLATIPFLATYETLAACGDDDLVCQNMLPARLLIISAAIMVLSFSEVLLLSAPQVSLKEAFCSALFEAGFYSRNGDLADGREPARLSKDLKSVEPKQDILRLAATIPQRPSVTCVVMLLVTLTGSASLVQSLAVVSQPAFDKRELMAGLLVFAIYFCTCVHQLTVPKCLVLCALFNFALAVLLVLPLEFAFLVPIMAQCARLVSWSFAAVYIAALIGTDYFAGTLIAVLVLTDLLMLGFPTLLALALDETTRNKTILFSVGTQCLVLITKAIEMHKLKRRVVIELIKREALVA